MSAYTIQLDDAQWLKGWSFMPAATPNLAPQPDAREAAVLCIDQRRVRRWAPR
jgi:hypothetical protein